MTDDNDHLFNEEDFDGEAMAFDALAGALAKLFKALRAQDLSPQESAALTAAFVAQGMPQELKGPIDGS